MNERLIKVNLLEEAEEFLDGLSPKVRRKVLYNMSRVVKGEGDKELFKKLGDTNIWEFRTLYEKVYYMRKCTIGCLPFGIMTQVH